MAEHTLTPLSNEQPQPAPGTTAVAIPAANQPLSLIQAVGEGIQGQIVERDLLAPRLEIAYGVGRLAGKFLPGSLVLDGEDLIATPGQPATFIPLAVHLYWKEYLTPEMFAAKIRPRIFRTEAEVVNNGGTTTWGPNNEPPTFSRAAEIRMLLQKPEQMVSSRFFFKVGNGLYAPCRFFADKGLYKTVIPPLLYAGMGLLASRGISAGRFTFTTSVQVVPNGKTQVKMLSRFVGQLTPEEYECIHNSQVQTAAKAAVVQDESINEPITL